jgi:hypothetical protein
MEAVTGVLEENATWKIRRHFLLPVPEPGAPAGTVFPDTHKVASALKSLSRARAVVEMRRSPQIDQQVTQKRHAAGVAGASRG